MTMVISKQRENGKNRENGENDENGEKEIAAIAAMQDLIAKFGFAHAINALDQCIQGNPDIQKWHYDGFSPLLEMVAEHEGKDVQKEISVLGYLLEDRGDESSGDLLAAHDEGAS
ncbi:hypothetical protein U2F10_24335 [Leptothoe sp. EHU-05/26/07-4]